MSQQDAEAAQAPHTDDAAQASFLTTSDAAEASHANTDDAVEVSQPDSAAQAEEASADGEDSESSGLEQDSTEESELGDDVTAWKQRARKYQHRTQKAEHSARKAQRELKQMQSARDELQEQVANQDTEIVEYQQTVARERLATQLARSGMDEHSVGTLLEHIDPMRLLADGAPSSEAITQVARSLSASSQRGSDADFDQGRRSDIDGISADDWLRKQARAR